jgi:hypothetical protein
MLCCASNDVCLLVPKGRKKLPRDYLCGSGAAGAQPLLHLTTLHGRSLLCRREELLRTSPLHASLYHRRFLPGDAEALAEVAT